MSGFHILNQQSDVIDLLQRSLVRWVKEMNNPISLQHRVTDVEPVEHFLSSKVNEIKEHKETSTILRDNNVEKVTLEALTTYFSTFSTNIKSVNVGRIYFFSNLIENELYFLSPMSRMSHKKNNHICAKQWLKISLDEGYIEPSQSNIECITLLFLKSYSFYSSWVYLVGWSQKNRIEADALYSQTFLKLLKKLAESYELCKFKTR